MKRNWDGLYGQEYVVSILQRFVDASTVPHAFLFEGDEGVGKCLTAIKFAQVLNQNSSDFPRVSKSISSLSEPYIKYIFPLPRGKNETEESGPFEKLSADELQIIRDEIARKAENPYYRMEIPKASGIKISSVRDIKKFLSLDYSDIINRIVLISEAHLMNEESQNALLKSLEEPPPGVVFILTTPYPQLLRETIRSRCWLIKFHPLPTKDISKILIEYFGIDKNASEKIAPFSGGSITAALRLIDSDFEKLLENSIFLLRYSFGRKYHSALTIIEPYLKEANVNSLKLLINMVLIWLNDLQRFRVSSEEMFYREHRETLEKFNSKFPGVELNETVVRIEKLLSMFKNNINANNIALNFVFELSALAANSKKSTSPV